LSINQDGGTRRDKKGEVIPPLLIILL